MAEASKQTAAQWVDAIDIHSDGVADTMTPEIALKESLKKDLQVLWMRKMEGKITDTEYNRYTSAAKTIFEKQNIGSSEIKKEYMKERNRTIKNSNTLLENLSLGISNKMKSIENLGTEGVITLQQKLISEDTLHAYNEEKWNHLIDIKEFEGQIKTRPIEEINALALKNYFAYLQKKSPLTTELLEQKFNWPERLLQLSVLWGTKLEQETRARKGGNGMSEKVLATAKTWITGTSEKKIENDIFKKVIIENIKRSWLEQDVFDGKRNKKKTGEQLDKKLEKMDYEDILSIQEFKNVFPKGKTTSDMVRKYFEKKVVEWEKKVIKLETEEKEMVRDKTVWIMFGDFPISISDLPKDIENKKMDELTTDEKKKILRMVKENNTKAEASPFVQSYIEKNNEIEKKKQDIKDTKHLASGSSPEALAAIRNKNGSDKKLENTVKWVIEAGRSKDMIQSKEDLYSKTLEQIGYSHISIADICNDRKTLIEVLARLEWENLNQTELYRDLKSHLRLEERKAENYVMAVENITEEQLSEQKKHGRYIDGFAEALYKEDVKQKKTTDFTIASEQVSDKQNLSVRDGYMSIKDIATIPENGKYIPLQSIGGDVCSVKKDGGKYILSINGRTEECSNTEEIKNTIDSYEFFYKMGLQSLVPSMQKFLEIAKRTDPICPVFDIQNGFSEKQQTTLLRVIDKIFDLKMSDKMSEKSTQAILPDFIQELHNMGEKKSFDIRLRKKWILNQGGGMDDIVLERTLMSPLHNTL